MLWFKTVIFNYISWFRTTTFEYIYCGCEARHCDIYKHLDDTCSAPPNTKNSYINTFFLQLAKQRRQLAWQKESIQLDWPCLKGLLSYFSCRLMRNTRQEIRYKGLRESTWSCNIWQTSWCSSWLLISYTSRFPNNKIWSHIKI